MKRQKAPVSELPHYDRLDQLINDVGHCAGALVSLSALLGRQFNDSEIGQAFINMSGNLHVQTSRLQADAQHDFARTFSGNGMIGYAIHQRIEALKAIDLDGDQRDNVRTLQKRLSQFDYEPFNDEGRRAEFDALCQKAVQYCQQLSMIASDGEMTVYDPYGQAAYFTPAATGFYTSNQHRRQDYVQLTFKTLGHTPERACNVSIQAYHNGVTVCRIYHPQEKTWVNNYSTWLISGMLTGLQEEMKRFERETLGVDIVDSDDFDLSVAMKKLEALMIETINTAKKRPDFVTEQGSAWLHNHLAVTPKCYSIPAAGRFGLFVAESNYPKQSIALRLCDTAGDIRADVSHAMSNVHKRFVLNAIGRLVNLSLKRNYNVAPSYRYPGY